MFELMLYIGFIVVLIWFSLTQDKRTKYKEEQDKKFRAYVKELFKS